MKNQKQDKVVENMKKIEKAREERRKEMEDKKLKKAAKEQLNKELGKNVDVDFEILMDQNRFQHKLLQKHTPVTDVKLCVCVRKRPIFPKEEKNGEIDAVSCANPSVRVHAPKYKVDGITKYVENNDFTFDNTFHHAESSEDVYKYSLQPVIDLMCQGGIITMIAYGQTGSGKTFTMTDIQGHFINDLFKLLNSKYKSKKLSPHVSFFEIYGGRLYDLLNNKQQLVVLEDKNNSVQIQGLLEQPIADPKELIKHIEYGNSVRTTHSTKANDTSSRSHAICTIMLKDQNGNTVGKVYLVDLAGSERAQDCQSNNRQRRLEGAEINKSLLALKECIRAMDQNSNHVPFRASKLTLVLRDSFQSRSNLHKIIMMACISPGSSSADHTVNTLRYVDRLKEKEVVTEKDQNLNLTNNLVNIDNKNSVQRQLEEKQNFARKESPQRSNSGHSQQSQSTQQSSQSQQQQKIPQPQQQPQQPQKPAYHKQSSPRNSSSKGNISGNNSSSQQSQNSNNQNKRYSQQQDSGNSNAKLPPQANKGQNNLPPSMNKKPSLNKVQSNNSNNQNSNKNSNFESEEELPESPKVKGVKDDVRCMKETMRMDKMSNEFFDFHEKVGSVLEQQEEIFATHMAAIKEDAKLLTQESELISNVQGVGFMDYDIDLYAKKLDYVIKKKLKMYNLLAQKLERFKTNLQEEEEISNKVKDTFYY